MRDVVKPAFIRWLSDLMKADKIIAPDEITTLEEMCEKYKISQLDIEKAVGVSLAQACETIKQHCNTRQRNTIVREMRELALSDGTCPREVALLILALSYCLERETMNSCRIVSFKSPHIDFVDSQVLFIEPHENAIVNGIISSSYKNIVNEMRVAGFDFIYIPHIARHYRDNNTEHLKKIIKYLAPALSDNEAKRVLHELSNMTTRTFCNEILKDKLGIDVEANAPAILIKIYNSYVNGERWSDFFLMEIGADFLEKIGDMIEVFLDYQRTPTITIKNFNEIGGNFLYAGFYKTIFDLVTYRRGVRANLIINHVERGSRLAVEGSVKVPLVTSLAAAAFYEFLIRESLSERRGVTFSGIGARTAREIQLRFSNVYNSYVGHRDCVPDITAAKTRNPLLSIIRRAINDCDLISEKRSYLPNTYSSKIFVSLDPHHIFINDGDGLYCLQT